MLLSRWPTDWMLTVRDSRLSSERWRRDEINAESALKIVIVLYTQLTLILCNALVEQMADTQRKRVEQGVYIYSYLQDHLFPPNLLGMDCATNLVSIQSNFEYNTSIYLLAIIMINTSAY